MRELDAEISRVELVPGFIADWLVFQCPNPRCARGHSLGIPFTEPDPRRAPGGVQRRIRLWQRTSGSTVDDLTLSPSIVVQSCDGLHGHVVAGAWVPC